MKEGEAHRCDLTRSLGKAPTTVAAVTAKMMVIFVPI